MLFSLIAEAIASISSNLKCGFDSNDSEFGPDLSDMSKDDTMFNEFDIGWALSDFDLF